MDLLRDHVRALLTARNQWHVSAETLSLDSPAERPRRRLEIHFRVDGDVDVAFHLDDLPGRRGRGRSPFEAHFIVHDAPVEESAADIARFVDAIVLEELVLVWRGGLSGGRQFVAPNSDIRTVKWVASWLGTYDRNVLDG